MLTDAVELVNHHETRGLTEIIDTTQVGQEVVTQLLLEAGTDLDDPLLLDGNRGFTAKFGNVQNVFGELSLQRGNGRMFAHNSQILCNDYWKT